MKVMADSMFKLDEYYDDEAKISPTNLRMLA